MSDFYSASLVPWTEHPGLTFIPPCPLDLDGPYAIQARPDLCVPGSTGLGGPLGFPAGNEFIHRNWKPYKWDVVGTASAEFSGYLAATTPGLTSGTTEYTDEYEDLIEGVFESTGGAARIIQPDFSRPSPQRTMISWITGAPDVVRVGYEGIYPLFTDPNGQDFGLFIFAEFSVAAELQPYLWSRGSNYLEHDITVVGDIYVTLNPEGGKMDLEGWNPTEGTIWAPSAGTISSRRTVEEQLIAGEAIIQDTTGQDPVSNWGSVPLWGTSTTIADIILRVRSNFLPHPGY